MGGITIVYGDVIRIWVDEDHSVYAHSHEDFELNRDSLVYERYIKSPDVVVISCKELASWLD